MADTVEITPGTGAVIGTDEVTIGGTLQQVQRVKLVDGTDGGTDLLPGSASRGLSVDPRSLLVSKSATPTISTSAYAAKDAVGGLITFSNAARSSGGAITVRSLALADHDQEMKDLVLWLFDRSITAPTDNAVFDPTDTEMTYCRGIIPISAGSYFNANDNACAVVSPLAVDMVLNGTDLYGVLQVPDGATSVPTYTATSDLVVTLQIQQH